jgi:hypothetical protein
MSDAGAARTAAAMREPASFRAWPALALAAWLAAPQAFAQVKQPLKLPTTQGEIRALMRETADPICVRCGVVTSTRRVLAAGAGEGAAGAAASQPFAGSSVAVEPVVTPVPVPVLTEGARAEREAMRREPAARYEVVVRYDDGSFGRIELAQDPRVQPGDRVKVEDGRVERYP